MSKYEYNDLLFEISGKLDANELPRLVFMCRDDISNGSEDRIQDVLMLFKELEKQNCLGIDRLDKLKEILTRLKKRSLLKKVAEFEIKRKAQSVGIISSLKRTASTLIGAVRLVCNFRTLAGGVVLVGSGLALRSCTTFEEYSDAFNKVIVPAFTKLVELSEGSSLCFTVQAETPSALNELWSIYKNGTLKRRLQEFLVSEEIKQLASGEDVEVTVCVDEQEYREAYLDLMLQQNQASEKKSPSGQRLRKNSDSFLFLKPKEDEVTSMKLEQTENKWNFKMQVLEREIEKLKTEIVKAEDLQRCMEERGGNGLEDLERPQLRRRRHSDTSLYCKPREKEIEQSENEQGRFLGEEKYAMVWKYLEDIEDTHSVTTWPSDSGIGTHGVPSEIDISENAAHQTQANSGPHPPKRPGYGTVGRPIKLRANFFRLNISPMLYDLYHYDVEITPSKRPGTVKRDVVKEIIVKYKDITFQGHEPAFDGERNLYSKIKLPCPAEFTVTLAGGDGDKDREFKVKIQFVASVSLDALKNFLMGKQNGTTVQDAVQALDIVLRQIPSYQFTPVGRSFLPLDGYLSRPLGEGCEVQFGFYQSIRHSEWKAMLVNIDVSAKGFYKSQHVLDFLLEFLELSPRQLEDSRFQIDKRMLEKAIRGVRIEATHVAAVKRKYTVWGVSENSADRLQFDVEDETSGRRTKTTVAQYFKDIYKLPLRYPHLPCLQVGRNKERYLPIEFCTIIPCLKRHLSEQQITNMIRFTARYAPERQQDIQYWAQEMTDTSKNYLKNEFQTSVDREMVKVGGRVLPAPRIKCGPLDQALIPRDGTWDMRNKGFYMGAHVEMWALACFAPVQSCNEDRLRNFCKLMTTVSNRKMMKMSADPVVVRYAMNSREVEGLFSNWLVNHPRLQLIMAVLPTKDKDLYSEIKRVGDNVVGIPTQCVQLKLVLKVYPHVCANISLKINSKLGGINHVIDPSVKSVVFKEPTIVFGADVIHPSPTENGIPSIAAVVASMDANATKYHARVRAQMHFKWRRVQEIISDLAVIVKELLIEFYKANGRLKPSKIIFYRNGVSEGQFSQVLAHEVRAVQEACMMIEKEYRPRITFVVVQKRHHTRLFCNNSRDASGRGQNVPPGTTVDGGITHPYEFDFYLCSHYGIVGTSRPTHYHVLYDDNSFTADILQQLTYQLCHVYARCTKSVSLPAPAYYAHLAAFRARIHVTNGGNDRDAGAVDLEKCAKAIQVSNKMKGKMYFI